MSLEKDPVDVDQYNRQWEDYWQEGVGEGELWDGGTSTPPLAQLLGSGRLELAGKRYIVPGCGRGYDVMELAKTGANVTGMDISETAVKVATAYWQDRVDPQLIPRISFEQGDFFKLPHEDGYFDGGYDYTFLCAIHTDLRPDWAKEWARLIKSGGTLVTLLYPVDPKKVDGPPFYVDPQAIKQLLEASGFKCDELNPVDPDLSFKDRGDCEFLGIWTRE